MATAYQNLSSYDFDSVPDASEMSFGIVVAEWNKNITETLLEGACNTLERHGVKAGNIVVTRVPGSFELTFAAKQLADHKEIDAVIVLGCVVRGDTPHFDYVCDSVTQGITELNL
ncbi:MAG: 6,7-dimethyl-8-ribityllumazine synthase, partial [Tannerellaceae bacterium]